MTCTELLPDLEAYIDGQLDAAQRARIDAHLAICADCRERAQNEREFSMTLRHEIHALGAAIVAPAGARQALLDLCRHEPPGAPQRYWRLGLGVAAMLAISAALAWHCIESTDGERDERARLSERYSELRALAEWQQSLAANAEKCGKDPALLTIACAYLPPPQRAKLLQHAGETPESLDSEWREQPKQVVRLQRSSRKGNSVTELTFEQWSDGRVHVEHVSKSGEDAIVTKLDAETWDILAAQNLALCRQLEIVDEQGRLLVGLPLPSGEALRRESFAALHDGRAQPDLAKRLLQLRLATHVTSRAELEAGLAVERVSTSPAPLPANTSLADLRARVEQLEKETAASVASIPNVAEPAAYFKKLCAF